MQAPASSLRHNLANHGNLPDLDDVQELLVYLTLLFIVLSWMLRRTPVRARLRSACERPWKSPEQQPVVCVKVLHDPSPDRKCGVQSFLADHESNSRSLATRREMRREASAGALR
jgi:hypothetical protein